MSERILARAGLRALLAESSEVELLGEAASATEAVEMTMRMRPEIVIIDAMNDDRGALEATTSLIRRCRPTPGLLVLANQYEGKVQTAVQAGANGLVLSECSPREFISAIHLAAAGFRLMAPTARRTPNGTSLPRVAATRPCRFRLDQLTDREFEVLQLVALGLGNAELSKTLVISESTVKSHIRSILVKLGLRNRVHLVIFAYETGFVRIGAHRTHDLHAARPVGACAA